MADQGIQDTTTIDRHWKEVIDVVIPSEHPGPGARFIGHAPSARTVSDLASRGALITIRPLGTSESLRHYALAAGRRILEGVEQRGVAIEELHITSSESGPADSNAPPEERIVREWLSVTLELPSISHTVQSH